ASYGNVVLHITGHGHYSAMQVCTANGSAPCADANGVNAGPGYWELMMPSTADFPLQSRIIELAYEGDRYLTIYVTNIDDNAPPGSLAHEARRLAAGRRFFQDDLYNETFADRAAVRNMKLHIQLPADVAAKIEAATWPTTVESLATLAQLSRPEIASP
ncbi:MAG: hypothetical protein D6761_05480, partial [Candidatus Dadabacteria bacterium]